MNLAPYQVLVTTYEVSNSNRNPTLTHIFYGQTLNEAYGNARAHLITDYFFSSSFVEQMQWNNSIIRLSNDYQVLENYQTSTSQEAQTLINELYNQAQQINNLKYSSGIVLLVQQLAQAT